MKAPLSQKQRIVLVLAVLGLIGVVGGAWGGIFGKTKETPAPEAAPATPAAEPTPPRPLPPPPLFARALPIVVDKLPENLANLSAQQCGACHDAVISEWKNSPHSQSGRNPRHLKAATAVGNPTACMACHLPILNQNAVLTTSYQGGDLSRPESTDNTAWDATLASEGVTCAACHVREGTVIGQVEDRPAPHPVRASAELSSPDFCKTCHQLTWPGATEPLYDTWGEWSRSSWGKAGVRCQDCHMAPRAGLVTGGRFASHADHECKADPSRALSILVSLDSPDIDRGKPYSFKIRLQNTGAGHAVPSGAPSRTLQLKAGITKMDGKPLHDPLVATLERVVDPKPPFAATSDTRLAAGEERIFEHTSTLKTSEATGPALFQVSLVRTSTGQIVATQVIPVTIH
jgi:hypothetical protein